MTTSEPLLVGIDGGGTSTRAAVAHLDGTVIAEAKGPGVNPNSGGSPEDALGQTLTDALNQIDEGAQTRICGGVAGLAGAVTNTESLSRVATKVWKDLGLRGQIRVVSDLVVAFWSGIPRNQASSVDAGRVLIAGTGAVAALVEGFQLQALADGYGYLLGDRGAGVWLGIQALRAALDGASGRGPRTLLSQQIIGDQDPVDVLSQTYQRPPRDLGRFAPQIDRAIELGDEVAIGIGERAVTELLATLAAVPAPDDDLNAPVVLVGSVAAGDNPIGRDLRSALTDRGVPYLIGGTGIAGALTLATLSVPSLGTRESLSR